MTPAFIQRLVGQCVAEGNSVRLEARVVGTPYPKICWKKGSDQVLPDRRTQYENVKFIFDLLLLCLLFAKVKVVHYLAEAALLLLSIHRETLPEQGKYFSVLL